MQDEDRSARKKRNYILLRVVVTIQYDYHYYSSLFALINFVVIIMIIRSNSYIGVVGGCRATNGSKQLLHTPAFAIQIRWRRWLCPSKQSSHIVAR
jgi:hypothetical protein